VECLRSGRASGARCPGSIEVLARKLADLDGCIARLPAARRLVARELTDATRPAERPARQEEELDAAL
jgi:hypothetical protein